MMTAHNIAQELIRVPRCPSRIKFGDAPRGPGRERRSATKPQSFGKLTKINRTLITMRWNFPVARLFF